MCAKWSGSWKVRVTSCGLTNRLTNFFLLLAKKVVGMKYIALALVLLSGCLGVADRDSEPQEEPRAEAPADDLLPLTVQQWNWTWGEEISQGVIFLIEFTEGRCEVDVAGALRSDRNDEALGIAYARTIPMPDEEWYSGGWPERPVSVSVQANNSPALEEATPMDQRLSLEFAVDQSVVLFVLVNPAMESSWADPLTLHIACEVPVAVYGYEAENVDFWSLGRGDGIVEVQGAAAEVVVKESVNWEGGRETSWLHASGSVGAATNHAEFRFPDGGYHTWPATEEITHFLSGWKQGQVELTVNYSVDSNPVLNVEAFHQGARLELERG